MGFKKAVMMCLLGIGAQATSINMDVDLGFGQRISSGHWT